MSDLAATNCGGGCSCNEGGCGSILWIILLLSCFRILLLLLLQRKEKGKNICIKADYWRLF